MHHQHPNAEVFQAVRGDGACRHDCIEAQLITPQLAAWISANHQQRLGHGLAEIRVSRLLKAFGMCCYFISPQGAAKILEHTFPLTLATTAIPLISAAMPGFSIDRRLNAFYPTLQAWITLPFLAYTPNDDSSTKE